MKIIVLTDLHGKTNIIPLLAAPLQDADLVLLCGDITHFGTDRDMEHIIAQIHGFNPAIYAVTGNCDHTGAETYLARENLALSARVVEEAGFQLAGLSGSLPCPGRTPQEYSEEEFSAILDHITLDHEKPLILVSHQPPYGTLNDLVRPGCHVGSVSIRDFILQRQPLVCFTGHIHEGIGIDTLGSTKIVNPGPASAGNYAVAEIDHNRIINLQLRNLFQP
jgi:hypothetical protein